MSAWLRGPGGQGLQVSSYPESAGRCLAASSAFCLTYKVTAFEKESSLFLVCLCFPVPCLTVFSCFFFFLYFPAKSSIAHGVEGDDSFTGFSAQGHAARPAVQPACATVLLVSFCLRNEGVFLSFGLDFVFLSLLADKLQGHVFSSPTTLSCRGRGGS